MRVLRVVVGVILAIQLWIFASLLWWKTHPVQTTMFMRLQATGKVNHQWQPYNKISPYFKRAVLVGEDAKFLQHHGFDWDGVQLALEHNEENGEIVAGGSTVSQQLSKNLFLFPQRSFVRKAQESIATIMMERLWSKQRILEVYMNSVELGENIYGVEAASQHYFHKSSQALTQNQAIFLAGLLPNPKYYQSHPQNPRFKFRQRFIYKYFHSVDIPQ